MSWRSLVLTYRRRRPLVLAACAVLGVLIGVLAVVPPQPQRAVFTVSRIGRTVRLHPTGLGFSFLPLAKRIVLPRVDGAAVVEAPLELRLPAGATLAATVRLHLRGGGVVPLDAAAVRRVGWAEAWRERLGGLSLSGDEAAAILASTPLWRSVFPDDQAPSPLDVVQRLAGAVAPLQLASVEVVPGGNDDIVRAVARQELARRTSPSGRLVVLGLDALDWELADELIRRGAMPNLRQLVARGAHAVLEVPKPLISPVVWTTIATGVLPEQHGVLDFLEPDPAGGPPRPVTSASRKAPAFWELAGAAGLSTATVGWWATFPAQAPPNGAVYSDRLTEQLLGLSVAVPRLADPPEAEARAHRLTVKAADVTAAMVAPIVPLRGDELAAVRDGKAGWDDPVGGLVKLVAATATVERLTEQELARGTRVVLAYLEGTDTVGHLYAPFMPPVMPKVDAGLARRFGGAVERYHTLVDAWIGRTVAGLGPRDTLVVLSDHGFTWGDARPRVPAGAHTATAVMWHRPEGMFLAVGPRIRPTAKRQQLQVLDVAPILLAVTGLPPAAEMPGNVPAWLFLPEGSAAARVRYAALLPREAVATVELPPEAREEELAKLRALGYLAGGATPPPAPPAAGATAPPAPVPQFDRAEARRLNNLASSRASTGDREGAEAAFRQAINADPTYAASHYNLSLLLRNQGRFDEADREFWLAVETGVREREMAVVQSALDYASRGDLARAKATFAEGRRRLPDSAIIWLNSGAFLGEHGDIDEARRCLERAVQLDPTNATAHRNLAATLLAQGDRDGARRELARAVQLDPTNDELRRQLEALGGPPPG